MDEQSPHPPDRADNNLGEVMVEEILDIIVDLEEYAAQGKTRVRSQRKSTHSDN